MINEDEVGIMDVIINVAIVNILGLRIPTRKRGGIVNFGPKNIHQKRERNNEQAKNIEFVLQMSKERPLEPYLLYL